jgi:hypothetical protein
MLVLVFHNIKTKALQREVKDIVTTYETREFLEPDRTATGVSQRSVKGVLTNILKEGQSIWFPLGEYRNKQSRAGLFEIS